MDAQQFDGLVKALRSGADRRRVLGVLAAGLAAVLGSQQATVAGACKKEGQKPKDKKECCSGAVDADGRCVATVITCEVGGACGNQAECGADVVHPGLCGCFRTTEDSSFCIQHGECRMPCTSSTECAENAACVFTACGCTESGDEEPEFATCLSACGTIANAAAQIDGPTSYRR